MFVQPQEVISQIFHTFVDYLDLDQIHHKYLQDAGVAERWINCCRSLTQKEASKLAQRLVDRFGPAICERHPLLIKATTKDGRSWWTLAGAADGILFPAFNTEGQILGIQLRKDNPKGTNDATSGFPTTTWAEHLSPSLRLYRALPTPTWSLSRKLQKDFRSGRSLGLPRDQSGRCFSL